ncbi:conserved hypothetical protein [Desulfamplus magnetovallimortis]|uniref:Aminoglycoside phosphotransferase domain-containing protein n=2 Tax=Desulfamplus magnetovallimortis TaxID=1246637 RepID=A0A1W1HF35_9BACT|nr:conserved hypothetical protein [Desulfamplus magnetovallimortis]
MINCSQNSWPPDTKETPNHENDVGLFHGKKNAILYKFEYLTGNNILSAKSLDNGRNSRVWKLTFVDQASPIVGKEYPSNSMDNRKRLEAEWHGFSFLNSNGFTNIPKPLKCSIKEQIATYSLLPGSPPTIDCIGINEIQNISNFIVDLSHLPIKCKESLKPASDACYTLESFPTLIHQRLSRFYKEGIYKDLLFTFLEKEFIPTLKKEYKQFCIKKSKYTNQIDQNAKHFDTDIPFTYLIPSPSDFGFHNTLLNKDGALNFVDFEFFGWDDPAKLICDTLIHPGNLIPEKFKSLFLSQVLSHIPLPEYVLSRIKIVYGITALKWCLILLNEFIPSNFNRRIFSKGEELNQTEVLNHQMEKARMMLKQVNDLDGNFPYE